MSSEIKNTGFAIAIAWPQTWCKQPGSWYDPIIELMGISRNNYYQAGHAALVLIDSKNKRSHYFDFGRYHSPFQHGRVRSAETDHDLEMETVPVISENGEYIENLTDILNELQQNPACHGDGDLHASYSRINFFTAYNKVLQMHRSGAIPYGPFKFRGSNCSRFVNTAILAGKPGFMQELKLKYFVPFTPTPLNNVHALEHRVVIPRLSGKDFHPLSEKPGRSFLKTTMPAPLKVFSVPENAQWLSGEGVGSWFAAEFVGNRLKLTRYSPSGEVECSGSFFSPGFKIPFDNFRVTYPSNCKEITIVSGGKEIRFEREKELSDLAKVV